MIMVDEQCTQLYGSSARPRPLSLDKRRCLRIAARIRTLSFATGNMGSNERGAQRRREKRGGGRGGGGGGSNKHRPQSCPRATYFLWPVCFYQGTNHRSRSCFAFHLLSCHEASVVALQACAFFLKATQRVRIEKDAISRGGEGGLDCLVLPGCSLFTQAYFPG